MKEASILIIDPMEENDFKERMNKFPNFKVIGNIMNADIGFTLAEKHQPDLIILNVDLPGLEGFALAETFALEFPDSALLLLTRSDNKKILRHALRIGAKDVITLPIEDDKLFRLVSRALQQENQRKQVFTVEKKVKPQFKTITVFSTKGGVGKTTIALNLALAIRKHTHKRTVLVDLNLMAGNIAVMAGLRPKVTFKDLVDELENTDSEMLDNYCLEHSLGLRILSAPVDSEFAGFINAEHVEKVLELLSQTFNYVIIDAPNYFHDTVIPALEIAQQIIVVTTLDMAAIQNLKQCLDLLAGLNLRRKARIVINRAGYTGGLKVKDLEEELGMGVMAIIPNSEKIAVNAVNMGMPLYLSAVNSPMTRTFNELASKLVTNEDRFPIISGWRKLFSQRR